MRVRIVMVRFLSLSKFKVLSVNAQWHTLLGGGKPFELAFLLSACGRAPITVSEESCCDYCRVGMIVASANCFMFTLHQIRELRRLESRDVCGEIEWMRINE